jgi:hypothetical protein
MLCSLWGRDAFKLIFACIGAIRSFDKIEKQECFDYTTRIYEQLEDSGALNNARADTYLNVCEREVSSSSSSNLKKGGTPTGKSGGATSKWAQVKKLVKANKIK